jgi:hypothetical protein
MWKSKAFSLLTQVDLRGVSDKAQKRNTPNNNQNKGIYPIDLVQDPSGMNPFLCPIGTN